jgi:hypothetical protein
MSISAEGPVTAQAPWPGSHRLPRWTLGTLPPGPVFTARSIAAMLGPGLILAGASIGGGEWLLGPTVAARYGGALLWVATLSILGQFFYNVEASRYALYSGEPIMTGKFRTKPGPKLWLPIYALLDLGALLPYQIGSVAVPVLALWLGHLPDAAYIADHTFQLRVLGWILLAVALAPLAFGGKVYTSLKTIMAVKITVVFGFLVLLALGYSTWETWQDIGFGLVRFGELPLEGGRTANVFASWWNGTPMPRPDNASLMLLTAFAAIAGVGGLAQTSISNYTRDQGWGMGARVGAIPSFFGGRTFQLAHVGQVFEPTADERREWRKWLRHVIRDQAFVWVPASFVGLALPAMLSVQFLPRGTVAGQWAMAGLTAGGVQQAVGGALGTFCWYMVLICGILVIVPNTTSAADGFIRRWVELSWTGVHALRSWDPHAMRTLYFRVLAVYFGVALIFLSFAAPLSLIVLYGNLGNLALGLSCYHVLYVNLALLPSEVQPGWLARIGLFLAGTYFIGLAVLTAVVTLGYI